MFLRLGVALCMLGLASTGASSAPAIYRLSEVRPGQKGYGLTTMRGIKPEKFNFEIVGIARNFLPSVDIILVKSDDPKLAVSGFWQGMSGSPLYVDDRVMCAFSYGFRFNKVALGGCTPIEYMMQENFRSRRVNEATSAGKVAKRPTTTHTIAAKAMGDIHTWNALIPDGRVDKWMQRDHAAFAVEQLPGFPGSPAAGAESAGLIASALPVSLAGFSTKGIKRAETLLNQLGLVAMQGIAGGSSSASPDPGRFEPGGSIAVTLVRGDMSASATGTVTYVDERGVLAFGHPMFQLGEFYAPVATADVHGVVPSAQNAFVLASPISEHGSLVQDRQTGIMADPKLKTAMIPLSIRISTNAPNSKPAEFKVEVLNNRFFTASLANMVAGNAASLHLPDRDNVTGLLRSKVWVKGFEPLEFIDYLSSDTGAEGMIESSRGLRVLVPLLNNPFEPVEVEKITVDADFYFDTNYGDIRSLRLPSTQLKPGEKTFVDVEMTRYDGSPVIDRVPFFVPKKLAGSLVQLEVTAGDSASLDAAPPENLQDLMNNFRRLLPGNNFAVTLYSAAEGAAVNGKIVRDLPSSALDRLYANLATNPVIAYRTMARSLSPAKRVVNGRRLLLVRVSDLKDKDAP